MKLLPWANNLVPSVEFLIESYDKFRNKDGTDIKLDSNASSSFINLGNGIQYSFNLLPDDSLLIAVPGSNEFDDWLTNVDPRSITASMLPGKYRRGWWEMAQELDDDLIQQADWTESPSLYKLKPKIQIIGHSLGAAVVYDLLAIWSKRTYSWPTSKHVLSAVCLAPPSALNSRAAHHLEHTYHNRLISVIHAADVVPQLLPAWRWTRPDPILYIDREGQTMATFNYFRELRQAILQPGIQSISDHMIKNYKRWAVRVTRGS